MLTVALGNAGAVVTTGGATTVTEEPCEVPRFAEFVAVTVNENGPPEAVGVPLSRPDGDSVSHDGSAP